MLTTNNSKLKNIFIKEFDSIKSFNSFKQQNPQFIVHDIKIIPTQGKYIDTYKIFLIYQEIKNNTI